MEFNRKRSQILNGLKNKLIVSCQALDNEPLYGSDVMAKMAVAAQKGGASGIRANSVNDILAIKEKVDLALIGIIKRDYDNSPCYITATMEEVDSLVLEAHPEIVAVDATNRIHPSGLNGSEFIKAIKQRYPNVILMADISTYEEGVEAEAAGADIVSTTLSGYTEDSSTVEGPDFILMQRLVKGLSVPIIGEGRIWTPDDMNQALGLGVHSVVVGSVITRPMEITKYFISNLKTN